MSPACITHIDITHILASAWTFLWSTSSSNTVWVSQLFDKSQHSFWQASLFSYRPRRAL